MDLSGIQHLAATDGLDLSGLSVPSLGVAGVCIAGLISVLVWVTKKIGSGDWVPAPQVDRAILLAKEGHETAIATLKDAYDRMAAEKDKQIEGERLAKNEWHDAQAASEAGRVAATDVARKAVESNEWADRFYAIAAHPVAKTPNAGDDVRQEAAP